MAAGPNQDTVRVDLERNEVALIIGEDDEAGMSVRVVAGSDIAEGATDLPAAPEIVLALATRLLKDPDFHDEVLDWYYEHQDEDDEEEEGRTEEEE
jgi:hypothetical protein